MGACNKITLGAAVEVGLGLYYAAKADAWALGSTTNSIFAVASAASSGGLLLCLALMLWRKFQGQPVTDSLATPVMLLAEGLYHNDQCLLDSAAILLPIQSVAIAVLWMAVSVIGATNVDLVVLAIIWYYCFAVLCLATMLFKDRRGSNSAAAYLKAWCLLPLSLLLLETVLAFPRDWKGGLCLLAVDGYVVLQTLHWVKAFALDLILAPPTLVMMDYPLLGVAVLFLTVLPLVWNTLNVLDAENTLNILDAESLVTKGVHTIGLWGFSFVALKLIFEIFKL